MHYFWQAIQFVSYYLPYLISLSAISILISIFVCGHVLVYKRDSRSSILWILLIILVPWLGIFLYYLFGINRIYRQAPLLSDVHDTTDTNSLFLAHKALLPAFKKCHNFKVLQNGEEAYPKMLQSIQEAEEEVLFVTYIFDYDAVGKKFVQALEDAHRRGVSIKLLLDGIGIHYSFPKITRILKKKKIPYAVFLPTFYPGSTRFLNLRNHRKLLLVDRQHAFLGGMNIREGHMPTLSPRSPIIDVHFYLQGEIIHDFLVQFCQDWNFASKDSRSLNPSMPLKASKKMPADPNQTSIEARAICDGPDLDIPKFASVLKVKMAEAQHIIRIVTPYFLTDRVFVSHLTTASMRGVKIQVVVPQKNNLPWMKWALHAIAWQMLGYGIEIYESPGPFDHSKIFTVDDQCCIVGSSNWDARSFRLNFELNVEIQAAQVTQELNALIDRKILNATPLTLEKVESRGLPIRIRDSFAKLFLPVL